MRGSAVIALTWTLTIAALCRAVFARADPPVNGYQVIANPANPVTSVDRKLIEDSFLKKVTTWPGGEAIHPVDLTPTSPVRRRFSEAVLQRSVEAVKAYWQQRIFSGRDVPPPELENDDDIVKYVLRHQGAVGYVSGVAALHGSKVLTVK
jgi:ABC-type phosphate transport system substrate-binding protein